MGDLKDSVHFTSVEISKELLPRRRATLRTMTGDLEDGRPGERATWKMFRSKSTDLGQLLEIIVFRTRID